jgi:hypothetical protein
MQRMKYFILTIMMIVFVSVVQSQSFSSSTGEVSFVSNAPAEMITASQKQGFFAYDASTGEVAAVVLIKGFQFKNSLMQEHFNENYMESEKFPESTLSGTIEQFNTAQFQKNGEYNVTVHGNFTLHGFTKHVHIPVQLKVKGNVVSISANFNIQLADYGIKNDKSQYINDTIAISLKGDLKKK